MPVHTLFVKSLPDSATNEHLEEICSEIGPVKQCFVVNEKGTQKCRGFGYVTYAMEEDAQRALKETLQYDGQRISLSMAKKKIVDNKKGASKEPPPAPSGKEPKSDGSGKEQKSSGLRKNQLKARLIIRNLSFKCSETELKQSFGEHGTVLEVKIPLKPDGKMRGFAFVQFKSVAEAGKALNAMNLKEIKGRTVAVDWAVAKDKYVATQPSKAAPAKPQEVNENPASSESDSEEEEEEETPPKKKVSAKPAVKKVEESPKPAVKKVEESPKPAVKKVEESPKPAKKKAKESPKPAVKESPKPAVKKSQKPAVEELPSDDDEDQDSEEEEEDDDDEDDDRNLDSEDDDDDDDDDDDYDDDDDDDDESGQKKPLRKALPSDVNQGRTVFIRNLSFDTEEDGLEEILLKFGELNYVKIVVHPDTEHSKGVAFAQFKRKEAADKCVAAAEDEAENGGIRADGRKLIVVAAVSKDDAVKLKTTKVKVETGTRNLYLAREGMIREGTKAAEGVPATDMAKRMRFEELKRTKLKDLQVFVSKTRLCVHNLPKSVDNKKLRALCLSAAKASMGARITECRVMYDRKPQKGQVLGLSLGYGFVEFQAHEHALSALRHLNNNPDIFGAHKRPIVEFSLEDGRKLKMKEERQQRNKEYSRNGPLSGANSQVVGAGLGPGSKKAGPKTQPSSPWQAGKNKAGPQKWSQGKHHSGFQTNPVVEHVEFEDGKKRRKVLPLPSHRGPKNRVRDKGKNQTPAPVKAKNRPSRSEQQKTVNRRPSMEKPTQPRPKSGKMPKRRSKDDDRFESLVAQYKRKLLGTTNKPNIIKKSKWFDS